FNTAAGPYAGVGGGFSNVASGQYAAVPGGQDNVARGIDSLAAGQRAKAAGDGAFVWADSRPFDFSDLGANNTFWVRATGGTRFVSGIDAATGATTAGVRLAPGSGAWSSLSDRAAKVGIQPVDARDVLQRVVSLP